MLKTNFYYFTACKHSHLFECINLRCIPADFRCDGYNDCGDYSDEIIGCIVEPDIVPLDIEKKTSQTSKNLLQTEMTHSASTISINEETQENSQIYTSKIKPATKNLYKEFTKSDKIYQSTTAPLVVSPLTQNSYTKLSSELTLCGSGIICLNGGVCKLNSALQYGCICMVNFEGLLCSFNTYKKMML